MSNAKQQWLVSGHGVVEKHGQLWQMCEACKDLLGSRWMVIAEAARWNTIKPWTEFRTGSIEDNLGFIHIPWSRGRLFGQWGELQWRTYRRLVRVSLLVDAPDREKGEEAASRLAGLGLNLDGPIALLVEAGEVALQTNDEEYTAAAVRTYGTEDQPGLFVRYAGWVERVKEQS